MMLTRFEADAFRNLRDIVLEPHPRLNFVIGPNGSGKSSLLEAIQCLAVGHTFRTRRYRDYLTRDADAVRATARLRHPDREEEHRCGMLRLRDGSLDLRLDFQTQHSFAGIARLMPVRALTPESHRLVQEGPDERRQFLDWGGFHGHDDFLPLWRRYRRALSQRNEVLRAGGSGDEVRSWNASLADDGTRLQSIRAAYVADLMIHVEHRLKFVDLPFHVELELRSGWSESKTLREALEENLDVHRRMRTTTDGPHRADLAIKVDSIPARQHLSRGEQKVLVYVLHLAQLDALCNGREVVPIVLCDDLGSELDANHRDRVIEQLLEGPSQTFVAGVDVTLPDALRTRFDVPPAVFAMNAGRLE